MFNVLFMVPTGKMEEHSPMPDFTPNYQREMKLPYYVQSSDIHCLILESSSRSSNKIPSSILPNTRTEHIYLTSLFSCYFGKH